MTDGDARYVQALLDGSVLQGPVLELGAGYGGSTCRKLIGDAGLEYFATDVVASEGVTYVADFSDQENVARVFGDTRFGCVLVLNVLEHTFVPTQVLDCALGLVKTGGKCVVITPALWPLHNYPIDACRLLPDWYERYASTRGCTLQAECFDFIGYGNLSKFRDQDGQYSFPLPSAGNTFKHLWSRIIHKAFNTHGRGMAFPSHVAIGAVFRK